MKQFEVIDISGDIGLRAFGTSRTEAFLNAAAGMYSLITDTDTFTETEAMEVTAEGESIEGLLVAWLNELLFRFDAYGFIGKAITITLFSKRKIKAIIRGEEFDPDRHERRLLLKAATYHKIRVEEKAGLWEVEVIFDI